MRYILLLFLACLILPFAVHAEDLFPEELLPTISTDPYNTLKGGQYQLELLPYKQEQDAPRPTPEKSQDTLPAKDRSTFNQYGYIVQETEGEFKISLSVSRVNLGTIAGHSTHTGSTEIRVNTTQPHSYTLTIQQKKDNDEGTWQFQPTFCDGGEQTCTPNKANEWKNEQAYGFGYSIFGLDVFPDFKNEAYFRSFPTELPTSIAKNEKIEGLRSANLTFKLVTPPSTEEGVYDTNVEIIAIPY